VLSRITNQVLENYAVSSVTRMPIAGSKIQVLKLVAHRGDQAIGHVAKFLGVSDPAVSQLVDSLAEQKLIYRRSDPRDRRTAFLRLTRAGRKFVESLERRQQALVKTAVKKVGAKPSGDWVAALQKLTRALADCDPHIYERYCVQCGAHADGSCVLEDGDAACYFLAHSQQRLRRLESKTPGARRRARARTAPVRRARARF
jgi:DNA-binding MarR family transcriptional regulator